MNKSGGRLNVYIGNIIHCNEPFKLQYFEKGFVAVYGNKIVAIDKLAALDQCTSEYEEVKRIELKDTQILIPGLIDTHIHAPQYPNAGLGYDKPLLDWLNTYTYPLEIKYKNAEFSKKVYDAVVKRSLYHGTTTSCYFATLFGDTSVILANSVEELGQRAFIGKVNMTRLAPSGYLETAEELITNTKAFVETVLNKKNSLVKPIITPRFVLSLNMDEMKNLADIAREYNIPIQSHISENVDEVAEVKRLYGKEYAEVYDEAKLLTNNTILAHAVHLTDAEIALIAQRGTSLSHCPSSNINLKSGFCNVKKLINAGIQVGLGTDVAGGRTVSIIDAMKSAIDTSLAISFNKNDQNSILTYKDAFYLATLGGAKALHIDAVTGNFTVNKDFDALIIDMDVQNGASDHLQECTPSELLQKFVYVGDDRNVLSVFVGGKQVK